MPRPRVSNTEKLIAKRIKEGRGQGEMAAYLPYIFATDFSSTGVTSRVLGSKINRIYHLFSEMEHAAFCYYDLNPSIIDIREQFPLLPIDVTKQICESLGIKHPADPKTKELVVMTVDFMLTISINGHPKLIARDIKPNSHLQGRKLEKFEISRRFFEFQSINYGIHTEHELNVPIVKNSKFFQPYAATGSIDLTEKQRSQLTRHLTSALNNSPDPIREICSETDAFLGFDSGTSLRLVYHLIATRAWLIDWNVEFSAALPGKTILL